MYGCACVSQFLIVCFVFLSLSLLLVFNSFYLCVYFRKLHWWWCHVGLAHLITLRDNSWFISLWWFLNFNTKESEEKKNFYFMFTENFADHINLVASTIFSHQHTSISIALKSNETRRKHTDYNRSSPKWIRIIFLFVDKYVMCLFMQILTFVIWERWLRFDGNQHTITVFSLESLHWDHNSVNFQ